MSQKVNVDAKSLQYGFLAGAKRIEEKKEYINELNLFFDCRNSRPASVQFTVGQRITFAGAVYRIETVEPVYDDARLHHYELGLS